jgi:hypothetical protein
MAARASSAISQKQDPQQGIWRDLIVGPCLFTAA